MKRFAKAGAVLATVIILCLAVLMLTRITLAEAAIEHWLSSQGLDAPNVEVARLDLTGLSASVTRAGPRGELQAGSIVIAWTAGDLIRLRVQSVRAKRVRIPVEWEEDGISIAGLSIGSLTTASSKTVGTVDIPLDEVQLRDVAFHVRGAYGPARLILRALDFDRLPNGEVAVSGEVEFAGPPGDVRAIFTATGELDGSLKGQVSDIAGDLYFGSLRIAGLSGSSTMQFDSLRLSRAEASLDASRFDQALTPWPPSGTASLRAVHGADGTDLNLVVEAPDTAEHLSVTVSAKPLRSEDDTDTTSIIVAAKSEISEPAGLHLKGMELELPLTVAHQRGVITANFASPGTVSFAKLDVPDFIRVSTPTRFRVGNTASPALTVDLRTNAIHLATFVEADRLDLLLPDGRDREMSLHTGPTRADVNMEGIAQTLKADISIESPTIDHLDVSARSAVIEFARSGADDILHGTARIAGILHGGTPAPVTPFDIVLHAHGPLRSVSLGGEATSTDGVQLARISGKFPATGDAPIAELNIGPFAFAPGALQPGMLFPMLSMIEDVEGEVGAFAVIATSGSAGGTLLLDGLSFTLAGQRVRGLNSRIEIRDLNPPETAPEQMLTIERIDMPVPAENIQVRFAISDAKQGEPTLDLAFLRLDTLGGTIETGPQTVALQSEALATTLRVQGIDLARIFDLAEIDGVNGTGSLTGKIPLVFENGDLAIRAAELKSGTGVLRIRSDKAADFLSGQGQSVDAALRALEDFRYSELTVRADRSAGGNARLAISVLGHNPAVLDGHPFRFNVNLTSNIDELVEALIRGYRIATDAVGRAGAQP